MISKIVTVTCKNDALSMKRQAESIQLFMAPCEHLVIVEDLEFDEPYWIDLLGPYYTNHTLTLRSYNDLMTINKDGWIRQQAFKLLAALECDDKYMVLDSKDFFIKPTSLSEWDSYEGSNLIVDVHDTERDGGYYLNTATNYATLFNVALLDNVFEAATPFVIDTQYIDKTTLASDVEHFVDLGPYYSEFIFYSYMAPESITSFTPHPFKVHKVWRFPELLTTLMTEASDDSDVMVFAFHRSAIDSFTTEQKASANAWLQSLGLTTQIE